MKGLLQAWIIINKTQLRSLSRFIKASMYVTFDPVIKKLNLVLDSFIEQVKVLSTFACRKGSLFRCGCCCSYYYAQWVIFVFLKQRLRFSRDFAFFTRFLFYLFRLPYTQYGFIRNGVIFQHSGIVQPFLKFSKTNKNPISSLFFLKIAQNLSKYCFL